MLKPIEQALKFPENSYIVNMNSAANHTSKQLSMERLQAFTLFQKDGMLAVEQTYPEHLRFVREHQAKTYREVKQELFAVQEEC